MPSARDVILKHIDAFNDRKSDAEPWAADAEMTAPGAQVTGRDNVIGFIAVFQEAFPDLRLEIHQLLSDGPAAAAEGTMTGTHSGVLHSPNGDVAPTGRNLALRWAAVYVTDGDTLKSEHLFFDQMDFLGQLGLLRASAGEQRTSRIQNRESVLWAGVHGCPPSEGAWTHDFPLRAKI